jgi:hypothetical protein
MTVGTIDMDLRAERRPAYGERIDCYALASTDLAQFDVLLVSSTVDQEHLLRHRQLIHRYLDGGGVLIFGGHLHRDWLPGASRFVPIATPSLSAYRVTELAPHPIFAGVQPDDLTFRRGVAGFFARGHHPPPAGAEVLSRIGGGEPATYVDRVSTRGTIVVHTTADLLAYSDSNEGAAKRVSGQLLDWARDEARIRRAAAASAEPRPEPTPTAQSPDESGLEPGPGSGTGSGVAAVYGGSAHHYRALTTPKYARHLTGGLIYLPDLADTDLTGYDAVIVPERIHRGLLTSAAGRLQELLEAGGTVVAFSGGEPLPEFLPGVRFDPRPTNYWWWLEPGADLGLHSPSPDHALFEHLSMRDCTWHYHGALTPPDGAEVLVALPTGEALLYVDRVSTPGTLVVATLDPMSHFGAHFMPATERFLDGFLPWLGATTARSPR